MADRTSRDVVIVGEDEERGSHRTPRGEKFSSGHQERSPPSNGYVRRQAAVDAESRLSNYTYGSQDVLGHGLDVEEHPRGLETPSFPQITRVAAEQAPGPSNGPFRTMGKMTQNQKDGLHLEHRRDPRLSRDRTLSLSKALGIHERQVKVRYEHKRFIM